MSVATFAAAQLLRVLPRVQLSRAVGRLSEAPLPEPLARAITGLYARAYRVNLEEADPAARPWRSFDEFFTRPLRAGARPIEDEPVVSPADGVVADLGPITAGASFRVKGRRYGVGELLGDEGEAKWFEGGGFAVVYLSPRDYHRVHSPVEGSIVSVVGLPGDLFPVNAIGERHVPRLLVRNNRVAIHLDTPALGRVAVVMVGATIVGRISVSAIDAPAVPPGTHRFDPPIPLRKGEELGVFHLGSTAVVLVQPGLAWRAHPGPIRLGAGLAGRA